MTPRAPRAVDCPPSSVAGPRHSQVCCSVPTAPLPSGGISNPPPPLDGSRAPQNACHPASRASPDMIRWPCRISLVSVSTITSASHCETSAQCSRRDDALDMMKRLALACGWTSPDCTSAAGSKAGRWLALALPGVPHTGGAPPLQATAKSRSGRGLYTTGSVGAPGMEPVRGREQAWFVDGQGTRLRGQEQQRR